MKSLVVLFNNCAIFHVVGPYNEREEEEEEDSGHLFEGGVNWESVCLRRMKKDDSNFKAGVNEESIWVRSAERFEI